MSLETARAHIAATLDGNHLPSPQLGTITLHEHQREGAARLTQILDRHRGAFLCDAVGLGKTYTALAVARQIGAPSVICPAALRDTWRDAIERAALKANVYTHESLSRASAQVDPLALLIVDEAHHFRNPTTLRYSKLASLCARVRVLLISATPIHNSRSDLTSLAALFAGSRARGFTNAQLSELMVRRVSARDGTVSVPRVGTPLVRIAEVDVRVHDAIMALPPPIPVRDGTIAATLVSRGLLRQWSSSHAALVAGLRRRIERARIIGDEIAAGRHPTYEQLRAWIIGDDSTQLSFSELLGIETLSDVALKTSIAEHLDAMRDIRALLVAVTDPRIDLIREIVATHASEKVVVFTTYATTANAVYSALRNDKRVALVTAEGGEIASGHTSRNEIIRAFAPRAAGARTPSPGGRIDILVATDLLGEGINLQDASVIVHADLPWTAARIEQREGRLARIGSLHQSVTAYQLRPPAPIERTLRNLEIIATKRQTARNVLGDVQIHADCGSPHSENANEITSRWRQPVLHTSSSTLIAGVASSVAGSLALVTTNGWTRFVVTDAAGRASTDAHTITAALRAIDIGMERTPTLDGTTRALNGITAWVQAIRSASLAGLDCNPLTHALHSARRRAVLRRLTARTTAAPFAHRIHFARTEARLKRALAAPMPLAAEEGLLANADFFVDQTIVAGRGMHDDTALIALIVFVRELSLLSFQS